MVVMEDLTTQIPPPCVMDIKIGVSSAGEDASPEKARRMRIKDEATTTATLGMRLTGMEVWNAAEGEFKQYPKSWGSVVSAERMKDSLALFFHDGRTVRKDVLELFVRKVTEVDTWFRSQSYLRFYSSSLLFLYDGVKTGGDTKVTLKMIDFAHVFEIKDGGKDDGYLVGLKNLLRILNAILDDSV